MILKFSFFIFTYLYRCLLYRCKVNICSTHCALCRWIYRMFAEVQPNYDSCYHIKHTKERNTITTINNRCVFFTSIWLGSLLFTHPLTNRHEVFIFHRFLAKKGDRWVIIVVVVVTRNMRMQLNCATNGNCRAKHLQITFSNRIRLFFYEDYSLHGLRLCKRHSLTHN